ncbi:MAG: aminoacyl--tRNA ligase-related protein [bacterium]|nr:aminoacyl--tRNA ligase-related protein [bacterium]
MKQSQLFTKTRKEAPKDEVAKNAELLIRAGYIHKEMAGVYSYLPLGLRVINKIANIIREEMNDIGGQELLLTTLQDSTVWTKTGRWQDDAVDNWFKTKLKNGVDVGIANTHEEPLTALLKEYVSSHRDLPLYVYQIQTKFRNELRAKSGILRGREFLMKDLYSFSRTEAEFKEFYEKCAEAYMKIFERVGLKDVTYRTAAAGGSFTTGLTDEFQVITPSGEDIIYVNEKKRIAVNKEVYTDETLKKFNLKKEDMVENKSIEVGNIFPLGTKYTEALGLTYKDESGKEQPVIMGSYGIGLGRVMGTIVEVLSDNKGIVWPESVAPFKVHLISLASGDGETKKVADALYQKLIDSGVEVLYDDRDLRAGEKFADSDLLGLPIRLVISDKTVKAGKIEFKRRTEEKAELLDETAILKLVHIKK